MIRRSPIAFLIVLGVAQGCGSSHDTSGPPVPDLSRAIVLAASPTTIFGVAGTLSNDPPAVRVVTLPDSVPVPGLTVTFSVVGTRSATFTAITESDGTARLDSLRMDPVPGLYSVFAGASGLPSSKFTAMAFAQAPIAIYDLQTEDGEPVPYTYSIPGQSSHTISGGHYVLFGDGSYIYGVENNYIPGFFPSQRFIRSSATTLDFYAVPSDAPPPPGFPDPGYLFSEGTVNGNMLKVLTVNYDEEVYILRQ